LNLSSISIIYLLLHDAEVVIQYTCNSSLIDTQAYALF
jgi:hypothetical protein